MLKLKDIRHLHIEASSLCNARCPICPRNVFGYPYNLGYEETSLTYDLVKRSFSPDFLSQISGILINGNLGDFTANLEILPILQYFREHSSMNILISTNGSARNREFWEDLAKLGNIEVEFCLDGLEDTHHLYRQDTHWNKIIQNAQWFIAAGGCATWKMIKFAHNEHQIESCQILAKQLGFDSFVLTDHGRSNGPAFNRDGTKSHSIGNGQPDFDNATDAIAWANKKDHPIFVNFDTSVKPKCRIVEPGSIYIASDGKVYPCCWVGMNPHTYDKGYLGHLNKYTLPHMKNNDLHHNTLEECIEWFNSIEESWEKSSYEEGRVLQCDVTCGSCSNVDKHKRNKKVL